MKKLVPLFLSLIIFLLVPSSVFADTLVGHWEHTAADWTGTISSGDGTWIENVPDSTNVSSITLQGESNNDSCTFHLNSPSSSAYAVHVYTTEHGEDLDSLVPYFHTTDDSFTFGDCSESDGGETIVVRFYAPDVTPTPTPTPTPPPLEEFVEYETDWLLFDGYDLGDFVETPELNSPFDGFADIPADQYYWRFVRFTDMGLPADAVITGFTVHSKLDSDSEDMSALPNWSMPAVISSDKWGSECPNETTCEGISDKFFNNTNLPLALAIDYETWSYVPVTHKLDHQPYDGAAIYLQGRWYRGNFGDLPQPKFEFLEFKVHYRAHEAGTLPFSEIVSSRVATDSGTIALNLHGDTQYTSDIAECKIDVFHKVSGEGIASGISTTPDATIWLDAKNVRADTSFDASGYYGYLFSPSSSEWYADNVILPYIPGVTNEYPTSFTCTEQDVVCYNYGFQDYNCVQGSKEIVKTGQGIITDQDNYISGLAGVVVDPTIEPTCSDFDLLCKAQNWFSNWFTGVFGFKQTLTQSNFNQVEFLLKTRAPFAYVYEIFNTGFPAESNEDVSVPSFQVPIKIGSTTNDYGFEFPDYVLPIFAGFRTFMGIVIWASLVIYLFLLPRRVL